MKTGQQMIASRFQDQIFRLFTIYNPHQNYKESVWTVEYFLTCKTSQGKVLLEWAINCNKRSRFVNEG